MTTKETVTTMTSSMILHRPIITIIRPDPRDLRGRDGLNFRGQHDLHISIMMMRTMRIISRVKLFRFWTTYGDILFKKAFY